LGCGASAYIPSMPIVESGTKSYVSEWFMHSVLFGSQKLYCSRNLVIQDKLNKIISIDSCRFGLMILADRNSVEVRYKVSGALFFKILAIYRFNTIFMVKELFLALFPNYYTFDIV
jgi:hypothetical protein